MDTHEREGMFEAVISQVVPEGAFPFDFAGIDFSGDDEVCIGTHTEAVAVAIAKAPATQQSGEGHLAQPFRQGHHGGDGM